MHRLLEVEHRRTHRNRDVIRRVRLHDLVWSGNGPRRHVLLHLAGILHA